MAGSNDMGIPNFNDPSGGNMGLAGSFQQPFVPQDLWQMPMTLEWDWAEGLGLGSLTPGGTGWSGTGAAFGLDGVDDDGGQV